MGTFRRVEDARRCTVAIPRHDARRALVCRHSVPNNGNVRNACDPKTASTQSVKRAGTPFGAASSYFMHALSSIGSTSKRRIIVSLPIGAILKKKALKCHIKEREKGVSHHSCWNLPGKPHSNDESKSLTKPPKDSGKYLLRNLRLCKESPLLKRERWVLAFL